MHWKKRSLRYLGPDRTKQIQHNHTDLIILDIGLTDLNGFDVCKSIRPTNQIPIIFLTARSEKTDRIEGLKIGADDYISKPFSPRELSARVKVILKRVYQLIYKLTSSVFEINEKKHCILYLNTELSLTRYEHLILKALLQRPQ